MADKLRIASRSPLPLRIEVVDRDPDGRVTAVRTVIINGASAESGFPEGVTENVDAQLFSDWVRANPDHAAVANGVLRVLGDDELVTEYGFEAGLAKAAEDADNVQLTEEGSTITEPGPVKAEDMAATSDTPNDDSPRSAVNTGLEPNQTPAPVISPTAEAETVTHADQGAPAFIDPAPTTGSPVSQPAPAAEPVQTESSEADNAKDASDEK